MYQDVKPGTEYDYFSDQMIDAFYVSIQNEITKYLQTIQEPKRIVCGACAFHDVLLKTGEKKNVWLEYNAKAVLPEFTMAGIGLMDAGIARLIIYDKIPDEVLDRFNEIKKLISSEDVQGNIEFKEEK